MQFDSEKPLAARLWSFRSWVRSLLPLGHTDGIPKCRVHQFFAPLWASFGDADETATDTNATKTSQNRNNFPLALFSKSNLSERVALPSLCWPSIGPLQDCVKRRTKGLAPWCQTVFNLRRHLRIGRTHNDSVQCQAAELLPQHLLSDVRYRSFQIGEAHHLASE